LKRWGISLFGSEELHSYYADWEILFSRKCSQERINADFRAGR